MKQLVKLLSISIFLFSCTSIDHTPLNEAYKAKENDRIYYLFSSRAIYTSEESDSKEIFYLGKEKVNEKEKVFFKVKDSRESVSYDSGYTKTYGKIGNSNVNLNTYSSPKYSRYSETDKDILSYTYKPNKDISIGSTKIFIHEAKDDYLIYEIIEDSQIAEIRGKNETVNMVNIFLIILTIWWIDYLTDDDDSYSDSEY